MVMVATAATNSAATLRRSPHYVDKLEFGVRQGHMRDLHDFQQTTPPEKLPRKLLPLVRDAANVEQTAMSIRESLQSGLQTFDGSCRCSSLTKKLQTDPQQPWCMNRWCVFHASSGESGKMMVLYAARKVKFMLKYFIHTGKRYQVGQLQLPASDLLREAGAGQVLQRLGLGNSNVTDLMLYRTPLFPIEVTSGQALAKVFCFLEEYTFSELIKLGPPGPMTQMIQQIIPGTWVPAGATVKARVGLSKESRMQVMAAVDSFIRWESFFAEHALLTWDTQFLLDRESGKVRLFDTVLSKLSKRCPAITDTSAVADPCYWNALTRARILQRAVAVALLDTQLAGALLPWLSNFAVGDCAKQTCTNGTCSMEDISSIPGEGQLLSSLSGRLLKAMRGISASKLGLSCLKCAKKRPFNPRKRVFQCTEISDAVYPEYLSQLCTSRSFASGTCSKDLNRRIKHKTCGSGFSVDSSHGECSCPSCPQGVPLSELWD